MASLYGFTSGARTKEWRHGFLVWWAGGLSGRVSRCVRAEVLASHTRSASACTLHARAAGSGEVRGEVDLHAAPQQLRGVHRYDPVRIQHVRQRVADGVEPDHWVVDFPVEGTAA